MYGLRMLMQKPELRACTPKVPVAWITCVPSSNTKPRNPVLLGNRWS